MIYTHTHIYIYNRYTVKICLQKLNRHLHISRWHISNYVHIASVLDFISMVFQFVYNCKIIKYIHILASWIVFFNSLTHQFLAPLEPTTLPESSATWSIDRWTNPTRESENAAVGPPWARQCFASFWQWPPISWNKVSLEELFSATIKVKHHQPSRWNTTSNEWSQLRLPGSRAICNLMHTMYSGGLNVSNMSWNDQTGRIPIPKFETLDKSHLRKKTCKK